MGIKKSCMNCAWPTIFAVCRRLGFSAGDFKSVTRMGRNPRHQAAGKTHPPLLARLILRGALGFANWQFC